MLKDIFTAKKILHWSAFYMEENRRNYGGRATLGIILVLFGGLFLLENIGILNLNIPHIIFSPHFAIFAIGILILINSRKKIFGAILTLIGGIWLLPRVVPQIAIDSGIIISIAVIGLGLYIIFRRRDYVSKPAYNYNPGMEQTSQENAAEGQFDKEGSRSYTCDPRFGKHSRSWNSTSNEDFIDDVAVFGGGHRVIYTDNFKGGSLTAIFGGSEIDLTKSKLAEGDNVIEVIAIFGGAEIHVPRDWNVVVNATPIFGGFANKIVRDPAQPIDLSRTLVIKGLALFGGIEINSKIN